MKKICIIGLWHQGIVASACMAKLGYQVIAIDSDRERIDNLNKGKAPIYEPGLDELLQENLQEKKLCFTTDFKNSVKGIHDILIMFDTKVDNDDQLDLTDIFEAVETIAPCLENNSILYVTAQVPVGTCDKISEKIRSLNPKLSFGIGYSPENLRLGQAVERFMHPALPLIGSNDQKTIERIKNLLAPLGVEWKTVNLKTAEMVKHALNAYIGLTVCFGNEIGTICDEIGADGSSPLFLISDS